MDTLRNEPDVSISDQVLRTWTAVRAAFAATIGRHNLTFTQWRVLSMLYEYGPATQSVLVTRTRLDKVSVSRAAQHFSQTYLVNRVAHNRDMRSHNLILTARGEEVCQRIHEEAASFERQILEGFASSEIAMFKRYLLSIDGAAVTVLGADSGADRALAHIA